MEISEAQTEQARSSVTRHKTFELYNLNNGRALHGCTWFVHTNTTIEQYLSLILWKLICYHWIMYDIMKYNVWLAKSLLTILKRKYSISDWNITCTLMNSIMFCLKGAANTWHHNDLNWTWQLKYYHWVVYSQDCFVAKSKQCVDQLLSV